MFTSSTTRKLAPIKSNAYRHTSYLRDQKANFTPKGLTVWSKKKIDNACALLQKGPRMMRRKDVRLLPWDCLRWKEGGREACALVETGEMAFTASSLPRYIRPQSVWAHGGNERKKALRLHSHKRRVHTFPSIMFCRQNDERIIPLQG